jgi:hypothetical protein
MADAADDPRHYCSRIYVADLRVTGHRSAVCRKLSLRFTMGVACGFGRPRSPKKTDVVDHPEVINHVGLLINEFPATAGCSLSSRPALPLHRNYRAWNVVHK